MTRVAVTSRSFSRHPVLRAELIERYPNTTFNDDGLSLRGEALVEFLRGHAKAIIALEPIDDALLDALPELKVLSKYGVGIDMIDIDTLRARGIQFGWTGGVNKRSVSELVICFAIALLRHVLPARGEVLEGTWRQHVGGHLSNCCVGVVGCGHVGKDLARLLTAFGCQVLVHDRLDFPDFYAETGVEPVSLADLLRRGDVVSLHLPLDSSTRGMLNAVRLGMMKPGAILINTARGGLVDEDQVKRMLIDGRLSGAAFDVFNQEPPDDQELLNLPNFIVTPHIGGSAEEAILAMGRAAIRGLDESASEADVSSFGTRV
jgi:phosphoglycerate dehydrogenase-like enzyme